MPVPFDWRFSVRPRGDDYVDLYTSQRLSVERYEELQALARHLEEPLRDVVAWAFRRGVNQILEVWDHDRAGELDNVSSAVTSVRPPAGQLGDSMPWADDGETWVRCQRPRPGSST